MMPKQLIVYMTSWCPNSAACREVLSQWGVPHTCVDINKDSAAAARVRQWTGFESVPTLVVAEEGSQLPWIEPPALRAGVSARGVDRGSMITEPNQQQLRAWLIRNAMLADPASQPAAAPREVPSGSAGADAAAAPEGRPGKAPEGSDAPWWRRFLQGDR
jgi:glutaredoxin